MHSLLESALAGREEALRIAIVGCGWFGRGIARELLRRPNVHLPGMFVQDNRERAESFVRSLGAPGRHCSVYTDINSILDLERVDAVVDASGDLLAGTLASTAAFKRGAHFLTVSAELDCTIGLSLARRAQHQGVIYSVCDGDQPGVLARMIHEVNFQGFEVKLAGCCKGYLNLRQTPADAGRVCDEGQNPRKVCSFADGSKQAAELAVVGNGFGLRPLIRGMHGPETPKSGIISTFENLVQLSERSGGYFDFTLGGVEPDQGGPVFVIATHPDKSVRVDIKYLKKGDGPLYLFYRDHHLCYLEATSSVLEAVLFRRPTLAAIGRYAEVVAVAKKNLEPGRTLDGFGGFDCNGAVEEAEKTADDGILPLGLAEFAILEQPVAEGEPIPRASVALLDNPVTRLRTELERLPMGQPAAAPAAMTVPRSFRSRHPV